MIIIVLSMLDLMKFKMWGIYLILNGFLCLGLFFVNGNTIWVGLGADNYVMKKLLKGEYNRYMNLIVSIMSFVLGFGILTFK